MKAGDLVRVMRVSDGFDPINGWEIVTAELLYVAPGYVRVRAIADSAEWDEMIKNLRPYEVLA